MSAKAAEQLIEIVAQARHACGQKKIYDTAQQETENMHERAIRFFIQSNQVDKAVKTFKLAQEFDQVILDKCLFFASYYGFPFIVKCLLDNGASPEYRSPTGSTPLIKAVGSRNRESVKVLLEANADVNASTTSGLSALQVAELIHESEIAEIIRAKLVS